MLIEGAIAIKAAIQSNKRKINCLYIDKDKRSKDFNYLRRLANSKNIKIKELDKKDLASLIVGKSSGGVIADVEKRENDELKGDVIFYLDGVEDPFNLGYMMRTLYAFGFKDVLLVKKDYSSMEAQLLKSSAGAFDYLNVLMEEDIEKYLKSKKKQYKIYSLQRGEESKDLFKYQFPKKTILMIGGEKRGIKAALLALSDEGLYIPYGSDFRNALNAAAALDVVATTLYRNLNYD